MIYSRNVFIINEFTGAFREIVNCSQKLFLANILVLFLFYEIFRLANFSSDPFDFHLQKRVKEVAPSLH